MKKTIVKEVEIEEKKTGFSPNDIIAIIIFTLYLGVDAIPQFLSYTVAEPQWIYINVLNLIVSGYIIFDKFVFEKNIVTGNLNEIFKNKILLLYTLFIIISGISILVCVNFDEGILTYVRYIEGFIALINLYFLFKNRKHTFLALSAIISITIFMECFIGLKSFFNDSAFKTIDALRLQIKNTHANKNIFSANILVKLPFIIFCIYKTKGWKKIALTIMLFITVWLLYLLGTRAIVFGLFLVIGILTIAMIWLKYKKYDIKIVDIVLPITLIIVGFYISKYSIQRAEKNYNDNQFALLEDKTGAPLQKAQTISLDDTSLKVRLHYWESSFDLMAKKPLLGCGLGTWKIESIFYERQWKNSNSNGIHMHNDFLEVPVETGIPNGIIYLAMFLLIAIINIKTFFKSTNVDNKIFSAILLIAFISYSVDSFFNFPLSRPTMIVIFSIVMFLSIFNADYDKEETKSPVKYAVIGVFGLFVILSLSTISMNITMYNFYKSINLTKIDNVALNYKSYEVSRFFEKFPTLDDTATPVTDIITRYTTKEGRYDESLKLINQSVKINTKSLYANSLRAEVYDKLKITDSIDKYNILLFKGQPRYPLFYERYTQTLARKKDTAGILKNLKYIEELDKDQGFKSSICKYLTKPKPGEVIHSALTPKHYAFTFSYLLNTGYPGDKAIKLVEKGLKIFPDDPSLLSLQRDYTNMLKATGGKGNGSAGAPIDYNQALQFYLSEYQKDKKNVVTLENLGLCYYQIKKYREAMPYLREVIASKQFNNGKSEYILSACHHYLGEKQSACEYGRTALGLGYQEAKQIVEFNCK